MKLNIELNTFNQTFTLQNFILFYFIGIVILRKRLFFFFFLAIVLTGIGGNLNFNEQLQM